MPPNCSRRHWLGVALGCRVRASCRCHFKFIAGSAAHAICVHLAYQLHMPGVGSLGLGRRASRRALLASPPTRTTRWRPRLSRGLICSPSDYFQDPGQKTQTSSLDLVVRHKVLFQILGPKTRSTPSCLFVFCTEVLVQILGQTNHIVHWDIML